MPIRTSRSASYQFRMQESTYISSFFDDQIDPQSSIDYELKEQRLSITEQLINRINELAKIHLNEMQYRIYYYKYVDEQTANSITQCELSDKVTLHQSTINKILKGVIPTIMKEAIAGDDVARELYGELMALND